MGIQEHLDDPREPSSLKTFPLRFIMNLRVTRTRLLILEAPGAGPQATTAPEESMHRPKAPHELDMRPHPAHHDARVLTAFLANALRDTPPRAQVLASHPILGV